MTVQAIPASRANPYTGSPLDRVSAQRDDEAFIAASLAREDAVFVPFWRSRSLVVGLEQGAPVAVYLSAAAAADILLMQGDWALLGLRCGVPVFAVDLSHLDEPQGILPESLGTLSDIRGMAGLLPVDDAAILAHGRGLLHWRSRAKFCGACGGACVARSAGNAMACSQCGAQHFPRTDPAVIMLVTDGDRALLGHSQRFPNSTMYSTLAGFVEPGESLEEAVAREVFEESGIRTGRIFYHSSQPWPFPASIMLGFHAEALSHEISIDPEELVDARWFTRAELRDPASVGISLPRADSIARRLIEDWIAHA
jgi:NAD+ diphosphatase